MSTRPDDTKKSSQQHKSTQSDSAGLSKSPKDAGACSDQSGEIDVKRNDEQQCHAAGVPHDPHHRIQQQIDSGNPDAGDVDEETLSASAPFNKTYGHHQ